MKRFLFAAMAAALAFSVNVQAQHYNNSRAGIVGGVTSASSKLKDVDTKSISLYHAGLAAEMPLGGGFAIQPELLYQVKGLSLDKWGDATGGEITKSLETKVGYIEVPVQLQWGPDLVAFRPYGFVEPFIGYQITGKKDDEIKTVDQELCKVEYGVSLGVGIDISHIQISAKYFWNFGNVYKGDVHQAATAIKDLSFNGFAISAAIFF